MYIYNKPIVYQIFKLFIRKRSSVVAGNKLEFLNLIPEDSHSKLFAILQSCTSRMKAYNEIIIAFDHMGEAHTFQIVKIAKTCNN